MIMSCREFEGSSAAIFHESALIKQTQTTTHETRESLSKLRFSIFFFRELKLSSQNLRLSHFARVTAMISRKFEAVILTRRRLSKRPMYKTKAIRMFKITTQIWQRLRSLTARSTFACSHFAQRILPTPRTRSLCGGEIRSLLWQKVFADMRTKGNGKPAGALFNGRLERFGQGRKLGGVQARCLALVFQCQRHWIFSLWLVGQRNSSGKTLKGSGTLLLLYHIWS